MIENSNGVRDSLIYSTSSIPIPLLRISGTNSHRRLSLKRGSVRGHAGRVCKRALFSFDIWLFDIIRQFDRTIYYEYAF
ncbi:MAG: hypothetical protein JXA77_05740, partial [Bacteroidales bacterium]|nr:hypothetical protein [Bacteroidales bacterium]